MIKWMRGFFTGIFSVSFMISILLVIFYKVVIEDLRSQRKNRNQTNYSSYFTRTK